MRHKMMSHTSAASASESAYSRVCSPHGDYRYRSLFVSQHLFNLLAMSAARGLKDSSRLPPVHARLP